MNALTAEELVCLHSPGPDMTMERAETIVGSISFICVWFAATSLYRANFSALKLSMARWPVAA